MHPSPLARHALQFNAAPAHARDTVHLPAAGERSVLRASRISVRTPASHCAAQHARVSRVPVLP
eukprot:CAMPEP_0170408748 /NCGR_PEP_ID=MMETSP0117_2-20130122/28962_1 /TAXON_ID=400756 /ORGANISM="Durinskia baltica, Strain CSIRO CS-38" /LENGTH=63 /DNA_ID=CAMNT_0010666115 /DNA_START=40 /DNA_END=228 /DNA_ORIENTATION=+